MLYCSATAFLVIVGTKADDRIDFDYGEGVGCRAPCDWSSFYPTCAGNRQSPVDLPENTTTACLRPLRFRNLLMDPYKIVLIHMLHTPLVKYHTYAPVTVSGGPFDENVTYAFDHYNIRWGVGSKGSEHTLGGKPFAAEVQLVFYDNTTSGFHEAVLMDDGLAIFSVWLEEVNGPDNSIFDEMLAVLDYVTKPWSYTELCQKTPLKYYLPEDTQHFYTYKGSLTYPPCPETVIWVVFQETLPISRYQLMKLRRMIGAKGPVLSNIRPTQSTGSCHNIVKVSTPVECA